MTKDKYEVEFPDGTKEYINEQLALEQGLTEYDLEEIREHWQERNRIENRMKRHNPKNHPTSLKTLFGQWRENEFALQEIWGFERNANYHRDFDIPYCTCPKLDNEDYLGTGYRVVTAGCIYHGSGEKE